MGCCNRDVQNVFVHRTNEFVRKYRVKGGVEGERFGAFGLQLTE